jgi:RNA recognition motif-containing protein
VSDCRSLSQYASTASDLLSVIQHNNGEFHHGRTPQSGRRIVYMGNWDPVCTEELLMVLFGQVCRVQSVFLPKDKLTAQHNGYGFVEYVACRMQITAWLSWTSWWNWSRTQVLYVVVNDPVTIPWRSRDPVIRIFASKLKNTLYLYKAYSMYASSSIKVIQLTNIKI